MGQLITGLSTYRLDAPRLAAMPTNDASINELCTGLTEFLKTPMPECLKEVFVFSNKLAARSYTESLISLNQRSHR